MRHYWLDRVTELVPGRTATGVKAVALAEDEFDAHFPGNPILPGIYLLEGLAQTGGVLLRESMDRRILALMVSIERARFRSFARPGDQLQLKIEVETLGEEHAVVLGEATAAGRALASARFSYKLVPPERLIPQVYRPLWEQTVDTWLGRYLELGDV